MLSPTASPALTASHLKPILIILAIVALIVFRRLRPQRVKPWRAVIIALIVATSSCFSLLATGRIDQEWLALVLAPLFLGLGVWLGLKLMAMVTFWRDETTGALWMRGGFVYIGVWLGTMAIRIGLRVLAVHLAPAKTPHGGMAAAIAILSTDPLFLSVGLWIGRASAIFKRFRAVGAPEGLSSAKAGI